MAKLRDELKDAISRTIDWIEANPDKVVAYDLATNENGKPICTLDPEATCFCALGRLSREMDINVQTTRAAINSTFGLGWENSRLGESVFEANDRGLTGFNPDPLAGAVRLREILKHADDTD